MDSMRKTNSLSEKLEKYQSEIGQRNLNGILSSFYFQMKKLSSTIDNLTDEVDLAGRNGPSKKKIEKFEPCFWDFSPCDFFNDFNFLRIIGKGGFGKILLTERKGTEELYAVKTYKKIKDGVDLDDAIEFAMAEKNVLSFSSKSHFLVELYACFQTNDRLYFIMEYVSGGDLAFQLSQSGKFKEQVATFYAAEIAIALFFLHSKGVIYRDLKLDNVLLDQDGHIKVADFGICKLGILGDKKTDTFCGTRHFLAPEIILHKPYDKLVDWWAYGVILFQMLTGILPFRGESRSELFSAIVGQSVSFPIFMSKDAKDACEGFLTKDPNKRLGFGPKGNDDIRTNLLFQDIDWSKIETRQSKPPFKPKVGDEKKAENFDKRFKKEKPELTALSEPENRMVQQLSGDEFEGFDYVNPNY
jgi:classical protein kinase C